MSVCYCSVILNFPLPDVTVCQSNVEFVMEHRFEISASPQCFVSPQFLAKHQVLFSCVIQKEIDVSVVEGSFQYHCVISTSAYI
jgi:hypothetical protein